jgi:hypothetical protein
MLHEDGIADSIPVSEVEQAGANECAHSAGGIDIGTANGARFGIHEVDALIDRIGSESHRLSERRCGMWTIRDVLAAVPAVNAHIVAGHR